MLTLQVEPIEMWDKENNKFEYTIGGVLELEHSLFSLSKWEQKWHKPFLKDDQRTVEESMDYIKCMTLNEVDLDIYKSLTSEHYRMINDYLRDPMTATTFGKETGRANNRQIITNEIIYYWMIELQIPIDPCQYWHLNRLMTLIKVVNIKKTPPKKRPKKDTLARYRNLNNARRQASGSNG